MKNPLLFLSKSSAVSLPLSSTGCVASFGLLLQHPCPIHVAAFLLSGVSVVAVSIRLKPWLKLIAVLLAASIFLLLPGMEAHAVPATPSVPVRQIPIDYKLVAPQLRQSGIPLHLPKVVVYPLPAEVNRASYVAKGGISLDSPGYSLQIGHRDCNGANSCTIARASATAILSGMGSIESEYPPLAPEVSATVQVSPEPNQWVQLPNGQPAYFVGWVLGASMGYSQLVWDENGYRYAIELKGGEKAWLLRMAKSAF